MPTLPRRTLLLALVTLLALVGAVVLYAWLGPRIGQPDPGTQLPSVLPTVVERSQPPSSTEASGSPVPATEVLLAVGDIGSCQGTADEAVAELASRLPGTIAVLGDTAYNDGTADQFAQCFDPTWGPLRDRMRPTLGNHEFRTEGAAGYFDYFGAGVGELGRGWYSYELGAWHVVVLNSNCAIVGCDSGSPQVTWLREDLVAHPSDCLLAYWHHPRWSSGRHGSHTAVDTFWQVLADAGADVFLAGHDHSYERVTVDGLREFVVGTGGRSLYPFEKPALPETDIRQADAYGLLWLALGPGTYDWEYLALGTSGFTDSGSGTC